MLTALVLVAFFALHQDVWFWRSAEPLVFGVLPVGLFYHAGYTLAVSVIMGCWCGGVAGAPRRAGDADPSRRQAGSHGA